MTAAAPQTAMITVRLFGPQARLAGAEKCAVTVPVPVTAADVLAGLGEAYPALRPSLAASRLAVNHEYVAGSFSVRPDDEVALIGLVSGG